MYETVDLLSCTIVVEVTSLGLCTEKYRGENYLILVPNSVIGKPVPMANVSQGTPAL